MPARHRKVKSRLANRRIKKTKPKINKLFFVIPIVGVVVVALFFLFFSTNFGNVDRVSLVTPDGDGNVVFNLFDLKAGSLTRVTIPGNTQVDTARNLGTWKVGSLWKLGEDQKVGGKLLTETFTKSLMMPASYWGSAEYSGLGSSKVSDVVYAIFTFKNTNLSLADRIKLGLFSLQVKLADRNEIDLTETSFLTRAKLQDGTLGYKVGGDNLPFELRAALADDKISGEALTILLENATGKSKISTEVSGITEVIGAKVSSINKLNLDDGVDCVVYGDSKFTTVVTLARLFSCKIESKLQNTNFDVVMRVGGKFGLRY